VQYEAWVGYQPALNRRGLVGRGVVEHDVHRKLAGHAGVDESAGQAAGSRLTVECRGLLLSLEQVGILSAQQREIVIDRLLALDAEDLDIEQVKWVVLMVLSSQPGQEQACARMEDLVFESPESAPH